MSKYVSPPNFTSLSPSASFTLFFLYLSLYVTLKVMVRSWIHRSKCVTYAWVSASQTVNSLPHLSFPSPNFSFALVCLACCDGPHPFTYTFNRDKIASRQVFHFVHIWRGEEKQIKQEIGVTTFGCKLIKKTVMQSNGLQSIVYNSYLWWWHICFYKYGKRVPCELLQNLFSANKLEKNVFDV